MRSILSLLVLAVVCFSIMVTEQGCANIVPPLGGPRDSLPPVLMAINPADSTLRFKEKKITLNFNEYVEVTDVQQNLLVSPVPKIPPTVVNRLRTITITIRDTLEENTTYKLDFGNSIKDINEGNIFRNFSYLFSTGNYLDSLTLGGQVLVAETGKADSTLKILLHTSKEDSAVVKDRPRYMERVDTTGRFQFSNLAPGTYYIYALKDEGAKRYLSKEQLFAFADTPVTSQSKRNDIMLYAFLEEDTAKKLGTAPLSAADRKNQPRSLRLESNASGGQLDLLSNLELSFSNEPIKSYDSTKIILTDSTFKPLSNYTFEKDTSNKKIIVTYPWAESTAYNVIVDTAAAQDTIGRKLFKTDTINFQTKSAKDYGLVKLRFNGLDLARNPVLQFVQNGEVKFTHVFTNNQFNANLFQPGEYDLRLFFDVNKNGKWDTGQFFGKKRQPEKVQLISRKINVKANWDTEVDINL